MARKKGTPNHDSEFLALVEREYVQGNESISALAKRYAVKATTLRYHGKKRNWSVKRKRYRADMAEAAVRKAEISRLDVKEQTFRRREVYQGFVEGQLHELAWRFARLTQQERKVLESDKDAIEKIGALYSRAQTLAAIVNLGKYVYPDLGPPEPPAPIFQAIISEQIVTVREVDEIPDPKDDPIIIDLPPDAVREVTSGSQARE